MDQPEMRPRESAKGNALTGECGQEREWTMRRGRVIVSVLAVSVGLMLTPGAFGASPQQIYRDLADNGRLDKQYSKADLQHALKDAVFQGYGPQKQGELGAAAGRSSKGQGPSALGATTKKGGLPFTGLDLALIVIGGVGLLLLGLGLRRVGRRTPTAA
jgi:hypothetical protein